MGGTSKVVYIWLRTQSLHTILVIIKQKILISNQNNFILNCAISIFTISPCRRSTLHFCNASARSHANQLPQPRQSVVPGGDQHVAHLVAGIPSVQKNYLQCRQADRAGGEMSRGESKQGSIEHKRHVNMDRCLPHTIDIAGVCMHQLELFAQSRCPIILLFLADEADAIVAPTCDQVTVVLAPINASTINIAST